MSRYQLIAFDMDGTLLDSKKEIRPDSIEAISQAVRAGKTAALSTGRSPAELSVYPEELKDVRYIIGNSGALVYDAFTHREIFSHTLSTQEVLGLFDRLSGMDVMLQLLTEKCYIQRDKIERCAEYNMAIYRDFFSTVSDKPENLEAFYRADPFPLCKFKLFCRSREDRDLAEKKLADTGLRLVHAEQTSLEVSPAGISKAVGLEHLCAVLNIPLSATIAVGDSDNDLDILRAAGLAAAMGNANDNVKAAADVIAADNDHGGCAEIVRRFLLD